MATFFTYPKSCITENILGKHYQKLNLLNLTSKIDLRAFSSSILVSIIRNCANSTLKTDFEKEKGVVEESVHLPSSPNKNKAKFDASFTRTRH